MPKVMIDLNTWFDKQTMFMRIIYILLYYIIFEASADILFGVSTWVGFSIAVIIFFGNLFLWERFKKTRTGV